MLGLNCSLALNSYCRISRYLPQSLPQDNVQLKRNGLCQAASLLLNLHAGSGCAELVVCEFALLMLYFVHNIPHFIAMRQNTHMICICVAGKASILHAASSANSLISSCVGPRRCTHMFGYGQSATNRLGQDGSTRHQAPVQRALLWRFWQ